MKECSVCKKTKPLKDFGVEKRVRDGRTAECKECFSIRKGRYQQENKERLNARSREWQSKNLDKMREKDKRMRRKHHIKQRARRKLNYAIEAGKISRPDFCNKCGVDCKPEAHHTKGYDEKDWLEVEFLCSDCHREADITLAKTLDGKEAGSIYTERS